MFPEFLLSLSTATPSLDHPVPPHPHSPSPVVVTTAIIARRRRRRCQPPTANRGPNHREDGYCAGIAHGSLRGASVGSAVSLNFTCSVVAVKPGVVAETFERALAVFGRPVDPNDASGPHQVR